MADKEIKLLKAQIDSLQSKDFDLEAWKQYTIIILSRIFGDNSIKIKQIEKIEYDFSSWSLRDTDGSSSYLGTCKKLGREILEASMEELKTFGLPGKEEAADVVLDALIEALGNELKGTQIKEVRRVLKADISPEKKKETILTLLKSYGNEVSTEVLAGLLCDQAVTRKFNDL